jgi:hypothetical protein
VRSVSGARSIVGVALLCALARGASEESSGTPSLPARVEVLDGRAKVALPDGVLNLSAGAPVQRFPDALHFEQSPESRARIGWSSSASLLLEGRTVLEWAPPDEHGMPLTWSFAEVDRASLEVRRGRVRLELPGGWRGSLQPGAYTLVGLSGGNVEFHHAAGLPVTFWPPRDEGEPLPPYTVLPGAAVHLLAEARRPLAMPGAAEALQEPYAKLGFEVRPEPATFPSWRDFAWPWKPSDSVVKSAPSARARGPLGEPVAEPAASEDPPAPAVELGAPVPAPEPAATTSTESTEAATPAPAPAAPPVAAGESAAPPAEPAAADVPAQTEQPARPKREMRRSGRLILSPYGPRWVETEKASPPARPLLRP